MPCVGAETDERFLAHCMAGIASALAESNREDDAALLSGAVCAAEESCGFRMIAPERRGYEARLARLEGSDAWRSGQSITLR